MTALRGADGPSLPRGAGPAAGPWRAHDPLRRALALLAIDRSRVAVSVTLGVLGLGSAVALAAVAAWLIARASQMPPVLELSIATVAVRTFGIGRGVFRYLERLVSHDVALRGMGALRNALYARLAARHVVYLQARDNNPRRWTRHTRDWTPIAAVTLNPERDAVVNAALGIKSIEKKAA